MRVLTPALALLVGSAAPVPALPAQVPWDAIKIIDCGKSLGTAFHIGNGRYITAHHVLSEGGGPCTIGGDKLTLAGDDPAHDLTEFHGPVIDAKLELNCAGFKPGEQYLAIGYALGQVRTTIPLIFSAFGDDPGGGNGMLVGADLIPGMSGGPTLGTDYRVHGIGLQRWPSRARDISETYLCGKATA